MLEILQGKTTSHLTALSGTPYFLHAEMREPFEKFRESAKRDGFELFVASAFRDHAAQMKIWNDKATGRRTLYDDRGEPLDYAKLSKREVVYAILRWSALPGASRHHWGTDIDIYDRAALPEGAKIDLLPQEAAPGGHQHRFARWLAANLDAHGLFRPYEKDLGGVSPEWWHVSYRPVSERYLKDFTFDVFEKTIHDDPALQLRDIVLSELDAIYHRYVTNINL